MAPADVIASLETDWFAKCLDLLPPVKNLSQGLVNANGQHTTWSNASMWGITYPLCQQYCNTGAIPLTTPFQFQEFAQAFTNYLLPWLSLTAQLPYETGSLYANLMSFCMAVGSPALATYSLTLTTLNRYWIRRRLTELSKQYKTVSTRCRPYMMIFGSVEYLLAEAQQTPLRATQEKGWLSSLMVSPANRKWWESMQKRLEGTRRGVTFSLIAQGSFAAIAWIFVIASAFIASLGSTSVALQISSGSLWVWMIPIIGGWIVVGVQYHHDTVELALFEDEAERRLPVSVVAGEYRTITEMQEGLLPHGGLVAPLASGRSHQGDFNPKAPVPTSITFWGLDVMGDEQQQGPNYNYARIFTWSQFSNILLSALETTMKNISKGRRVADQDPSVTGEWAEIDGDKNLNGDAAQTAAYCGLENGTLPAYASWSDMWNHPKTCAFRYMAGAALTALLIQWGTTGAAILIAYNTPLVGFGCRSAAYTLYGVLGTVGWVLHVVSMCFSHSAMLRYQRALENDPMLVFSPEEAKDGVQVQVKEERQDHEMGNLQPNGVADNNAANQRRVYERTKMHSLICFLAVFTRFLGKTVIAVNALWMVVSSLLEMINVYENCYCSSNRGTSSWVLISKSAADLKAAAQTTWGGGVALSIMSSLLGFLVFWLGSRKR